MRMTTHRTTAATVALLSFAGMAFADATGQPPPPAPHAQAPAPAAEPTPKEAGAPGDKKPQLGDGIGNLTTKNDSRASIWVTIYSDGLPRKILQSGCVQPGGEGKWRAWPYDHPSFFIRAEMTRNANCQHPVDCDTTMELLAWKYRNHRYNYRVTFKANPQNCWWDHGMH